MDPQDSATWNTTVSAITVGGVPLYQYVHQIAHDACTNVVAERLGYALRDEGVASWD